MDDDLTRFTTTGKVSEPVPGTACLVLIYPPSPLMGQRFPLQASPLYIGRGSDCQIQVDLDSVSRRHALIRESDAKITIEDLGSTNGTYVNEEQIEQQALKHGDLIHVGKIIFKFLYSGNVEAEYHEAIYRMTIIDGLTEAYNKRFLLDFLEREIASCIRHQKPLSLAMLDLDHFKNVNDTHGHLTGDQVLREISRRIRDRIRSEEILARYGGEEFAVVMPDTDHQGALVFGEQLRQLVFEEPVRFEGEEIPVSISVGVATVVGESIDPEALIKIADNHLYEAKRTGRNRVVG